MDSLKPHALGLSLGLLSALCMLVFGIIVGLGYYQEAFEITKAFHQMFDSTPKGILLGMIECGILGYITGFLVAYFYNLFLPKA